MGEGDCLSWPCLGSHTASPLLPSTAHRPVTGSLLPPDSREGSKTPPRWTPGAGNALWLLLDNTICHSLFHPIPATVQWDRDYCYLLFSDEKTEAQVAGNVLKGIESVHVVAESSQPSAACHRLPFGTSRCQSPLHLSLSAFCFVSTSIRHHLISSCSSQCSWPLLGIPARFPNPCPGPRGLLVGGWAEGWNLYTWLITIPPFSAKTDQIWRYLVGNLEQILRGWTRGYVSGFWKICLFVLQSYYYMSFCSSLSYFDPSSSSLKIPTLPTDIRPLLSWGKMGGPILTAVS